MDNESLLLCTSISAGIVIGYEEGEYIWDPIVGGVEGFVIGTFLILIFRLLVISGLFDKFTTFTSGLFDKSTTFTSVISKSESGTSANSDSSKKEKEPLPKIFKDLALAGIFVLIAVAILSIISR